MATVTFATSKRASCSLTTGGIETCRQCSIRTTKDCQACKGTMMVQSECSGCRDCKQRTRKDSGVDFKDVPRPNDR
ncbi:hypothetical protein CB0940_11737 [Cercospora beticola]|uniref:Uncharacterized protein n=1 Tax=Cercospora beticola TaxID=122368 RepID=A0A2G5IDL9_CERBT|nr:hypothetical protein CB0940_11737 [Cercospora beticola]PIB02840.1 hypothetical protein CB0940_11737 [Cercospora beticola]WPB04094.1 hypothetical protein RHO25_008738 [Cercospora beticola]CAK1357115.1 unnamed protein product [Cercospora beticola]